MSSYRKHLAIKILSTKHKGDAIIMSKPSILFEQFKQNRETGILKPSNYELYKISAFKNMISGKCRMVCASLFAEHK